MQRDRSREVAPRYDGGSHAVLGTEAATDGSDVLPGFELAIGVLYSAQIRSRAVVRPCRHRIASGQALTDTVARGTTPQR